RSNTVSPGTKPRSKSSASVGAFVPTNRAGFNNEERAMKTSKPVLALVAAIGLTIVGGASAEGNKATRDQVYASAEAQYKTDKAACDGMSGNAKDICVQEAKGNEKVAKADADAAYEGTPKAREAARVARADAAYNVAKEKCDDLSGNQKDVCVKEAKAAHV